MYEALYRKYRPKTFDDVVGQPFITETLKTQVRTGRLSHAYLFIGTRGTGKTSCARILAKAVNCEHPVDGNPCNECDACRGIEDGSVLDVVELDAASNNGVDDVRMLRDEAIFSPTTVRKRVYIIDEVHMLSKPAFNALLKILEEPPQHLMFILATTELHKVLPTILSRCQRHSFRRLDGDFDNLRISANGININVRITERVPYSKIVVDSVESPIKFTVTLNFLDMGGHRTEFFIELDAELNFLMKQMLGKKIENGLDTIIDTLEKQSAQI